MSLWNHSHGCSVYQFSEEGVQGEPQGHGTPLPPGDGPHSMGVLSARREPHHTTTLWLHLSLGEEGETMVTPDCRYEMGSQWMWKAPALYALCSKWQKLAMKKYRRKGKTVKLIKMSGNTANKKCPFSGEDSLWLFWRPFLWRWTPLPQSLHSGTAEHLGHNENHWKCVLAMTI